MVAVFVFSDIERSKSTVLGAGRDDRYFPVELHKAFENRGLAAVAMTC